MRRKLGFLFLLTLFYSTTVVAQEGGYIMQFPDTIGRMYLSHRLHPATSGPTAQNYDDSVAFATRYIKATQVALDENKIATALFNISEAIKLTPQEEIRTLAIAHSYYAIIQIELNSHSKAVKAINYTDSLFNIIKDYSLFAFHYNNLGVFSKKFISQERADFYFKKSLDLSRRMLDYPNVAITLNHLSQGADERDVRLGYAREAATINKNIDAPLQLAKSYNNIAHIHLLNRVYDSTFYYLKKSHAITKDLPPNPARQQLYLIYSELYAAIGNYKEAYHYIKEYNESLVSHDKEYYNASDVEKMIEDRAIATKNFEIKLRDNQLKIRKLTYLRTLFVSLFILLALGGSYLLYYINSRRKLQLLEERRAVVESEKNLIRMEKEYLENEKRFAERELSTVAAHFNSRNEILKNIQQELTKAYRLPDDKISAELRKINLNIRNLLERNEDLKEILERTEKINVTFLSRLMELHPETTKNERNIALMLRAGLSSKQIATLLDCNPKSVNMARYRMRSHMGLDSSDNLVQYLKSL